MWRQGVLNRDIELAVSSVAGRQLTADQKAAFAARMKPLQERQRAIAELAKSIQPPSGKEGKAAISARCGPRGGGEDRPRSRDAARPEHARDRRRQEPGPRAAPSVWPTTCRTPGGDRSRRGRSSTRRGGPHTKLPRRSAGTSARPTRARTIRRRRQALLPALAERLNPTADKQARVVAALEAMEPEDRAALQHQRAIKRAKYAGARTAATCGIRPSARRLAPC